LRRILNEGHQPPAFCVPSPARISETENRENQRGEDDRPQLKGISRRPSRL
jgi:hypothetical protein